MGSTITSIRGLQNLSNLQDFRADWNSFTSVDLSGLTSLTYVDISDSELPESGGQPSLTSVNLTGCTALQELRLDDSDFSDGIPDLTDLTSLEWLDMDQCGITGNVDLSMLTALTGFDLSGNSITSVYIPESVSNVNLYGNALTLPSVDDILMVLNYSGLQNGNVDLSGGTNAVINTNTRSIITSLENKGWNVSVNTPPPGNVGIAASTDFDIVGNFTIEMFVNMSNLAGFPRPYSFGAYPAPNAISIEGGQLYFWGNGSALINGPFEPTLGEWYHICVQRNSSTIRLFVNGVQIAITTGYADNIPSQGLPLTIGYGNEENSQFDGLMSNFRWSAGARYNPNGFAVPTAPLVAEAGITKLLIFQGTTLPALLTDNSGNGNNATNAGSFYNTADPFNSSEGSLRVGITI